MSGRKRENLITLAAAAAVQQRAPSHVVIKEILHYEILFALVQSGLASQLVFQGGTALRLCWGGSRYSEDLDFCKSGSISESDFSAFTTLLKATVLDAYGLDAEVKLHQGADEGIRVDRWTARIAVPNPNPAVSQKQIINIEIAAVPAREHDLVAVQVNYSHLPPALRQMMLRVETQEEILADKIIALVCRPYLKNRDVWDVKMLMDRQVPIRHDLVELKRQDYHWTPEAFDAALMARIEQLNHHEALAAPYVQEMSRFVNAGVASQLPQIAQRQLQVSGHLLRTVAEARLTPTAGGPVLG